MTALTAEELMAWVDRTHEGWRGLLAAQPEVLLLPCDVAGGGSVAGLLQHVMAVELRYAERLHGRAVSPYEQVANGSAEELHRTHEQAFGLLRGLLAEQETDWEETIEFETRTGGRWRATRRAVLVHLLMHSVRHYAQLATMVRQQGVKPGWPMDYLFMQGRPV